MAANMKLGEAILYLTGDSKGLDKTLANTGESLKSIGKSLTIFGGAVVGAIGVAVKKFADFGDTLNDASQRTGVSAQSLGELSHALQLSGSNLDDFEVSMKRLQRVMTDAQESETKTVDNMEAIGKASRNLQVASMRLSEMQRAGTASASAMMSQRNKVAEYQAELQKLHATHGQVIQGTNASADALKQLGIDYTSLQGMKPEDQFMMVAEALSRVSDASRRAALAQEVFGRSGTRMLPLINEGAAGIAKLRAEVAGTDFAAAAVNGDAFNDAMQRLQASLFAVGATLMTELMPTLTAFMEERLIPAIRWISAFTQEHEKLATAIVFVVGGIGSLALVLGPVLIAVGSLMTAMSGVGAVIGPLTGAVVGLAGAVGMSAGGLGAAVVATFAVFYRFGQWLDNTFRGTIDSISQALYDAGRGLLQFFGIVKKQDDLIAGTRSAELVESGQVAVGGGRVAKNNAETQAAVNRALGVPGFALGGVIPRSGLALVGERGPELVNLPRGSRVHSARETREMVRGGAGDTSTPVTINISMGGVAVREEADVGRIARQLGRLIDSRLVARGMRPVTA
jgi:hypothetical protein